MRNSLRVIKRNYKLISKGIKLSYSFFFVQLIWVLFGSFITVLNVIIPKFLIEAIQNHSFKQAFQILLIALGINLLGSVAEIFYTPYIALSKEKINVKIIDEFLKKSFSLDLEYFDNPKFYDKYSIVFDNCCDLVHSAIETFLSLISSITQIALVFSILLWMNKWILVVMLLIIFIQLIIDKRRKKIQYEYQKNITKQNRQLNYLYRLFYIPQFMRDIRVNSLKSFIFNKKNEATDELLGNVKSTNKKLSIITFFVSVLSHLETFFISSYFVLQAYRGYILIGDFFISLNSYNTLKSSISRLFATYNTFYSNDLYINEYMSFMDIECSSENKGSLKLSADEIMSVEFINVSFTYPNSHCKALDNISFSIKKGDKIAIIGNNGAGKTTIIKLLLRLYEPQEGIIKINGRDIREYDINELRNAISVLFQDYTIYPFTIRENISLGKDISDEVIEDALERVGLLDKVRNMPLVLNTPITSQMLDAGIEFSGGESQRIAIARIYAGNKGFIVLDEPTSNLDPYIEHELYESILNDLEESTVIIISHRLTFTYRMSKIICIIDGKIVEEGTHKDLIKIKNGYYSRMFDLGVVKYIQKEDSKILKTSNF